jgi:hypothetical protein
VTDPFATADDATAYAYALPGASADGLLARATQAIIDAAGFGILSSSATVRLRAEHSVISLAEVPLVTAVSAVVLVHEDDTTESVSGWHWQGTVAGHAVDIWLDSTVTERHCGIFAVTLTQGLAAVPDSLKLLTARVAYRFAGMPTAMAAGITSRSVGSVSWSAAGKAPADGELTDAEVRQLAKIVPLQRVWQVPA